MCFLFQSSCEIPIKTSFKNMNKNNDRNDRSYTEAGVVWNPMYTRYKRQHMEDITSFQNILYTSNVTCNKKQTHVNLQQQNKPLQSSAVSLPLGHELCSREIQRNERSCQKSAHLGLFHSHYPHFYSNTLTITNCNNPYKFSELRVAAN